MNIWLFTVNFGDTKPTNELIDSIKKCNKNNKINITIIDNKSSKKSKTSLEKIKHKHDLKIETIYNKSNYYYWPSVSKVLSKKFKKNDYPDWLIICNNDIVLIDEKLFQKLDDIDGDICSVFGPNIINSKNKSLNQYLQN